MKQVPTRAVPSVEGSLVKPLAPEKLIDWRKGEAEPDDATQDLALNAEMRWEAMAGRGYLTPVDRFFVRNHAPTPRIERSAWRLRVEGPGVERPLELGYEDLLRRPSVSVTRALECAGNGRAFFAEKEGHEAPGTQWRLGAVGVAEWTGASLGGILKSAGLKKTAREAMLEGLDSVRMRRPLPLWKALEEDTILAFGMNGGPLPPDHGFPVRAIVPGWAAVASVKWVGRIFVSEEPLTSPWNTDKYVMTGGPWQDRREPITGQVPKSALELPWPATLRPGRHAITGRSWSAETGISRVEYSIDGGPWRRADLFDRNVPGAWARWRFVWRAEPGSHRVAVRATDLAGVVQPPGALANELGYLYGGVVEHPVEVR